MSDYKQADEMTNLEIINEVHASEIENECADHMRLDNLTGTLLARTGKTAAMWLDELGMQYS